MIFAAGLGTRLRPLTNDRPKALVEVAGRTMLERVIERIHMAGIDHIVINVHHFADKIVNFLRERNNFGLNIVISDESGLLLDTGGGILKARRLLDDGEPFLVHNADILTDMDLRAMIKAHCHHQAMATLLVKARETQRYFLFDKKSQLRGWINKKTSEVRPDSLNVAAMSLRELAFGGIHVISPAIFPVLEQYASGRDVFGITPFYIDSCTDHLIMGYEPREDYQWFDVGKPETLSQASVAMSS